MHCLFSAPLTVLLEFDFALDFLLVFAGPIVNTLAGSARELDEAVLRHICITS